MSELTELQQAIKTVVDQNPGWDDEQVAKAAFSTLNPGESWEGRGPTTTYVQKLRRRFARESRQPTIEVEIPEFLFTTPEEDEETEPEDEEFDPFEGLDLEPEQPTPTKAAPAYDTTVDFTDDDLNAIIGLPFSKLAAYTGYPGWRLDPTDPDDARFIHLTNKMAHKHVPDILDKYGLEVLWSISLIGFLGERMAGHRRHKAERSTALKKAQAEKEKPQEAPEPEPTPEPQAPPEPQLKPGELAVGEEEFRRRLKRQ